MTATTATRNRIEPARALLKENALDLLVVGPGSDMAYLIGHFGHPSERPAFLIIPKEGTARIVIAAFESRALPPIPDGIEVLTYTETEDGFEVVRSAVAGYPQRPEAIAIGDQMWASFLLRWQQILPNASFRPASQYLRELRMLKNAEELRLLASAAERADEALARVLESSVEGQTEVEVALRLGQAMTGQELTEPWAIVASGPNGASPHHLSGDRVIARGDAVVIDFGGRLKGYHADVTRTVFVGVAAEDGRAVYEIVRAAQQAAVDAARPDRTCESVDLAARSRIEAAGFGEAFAHRTGHGIGLDIHEDPYIVQGSNVLLRPGMTHSVEPGIYLEGRFGVRIEDIVAITDTGSRRLNEFTRELLVVD